MLQHQQRLPRALPFSLHISDQLPASVKAGAFVAHHWAGRSRVNFFQGQSELLLVVEDLIAGDLFAGMRCHHSHVTGQTGSIGTPVTEKTLTVATINRLPHPLKTTPAQLVCFARMIRRTVMLANLDISPVLHRLAIKLVKYPA